MTERSSFDPSKYLTKVGSADYLEVKWRLVWLRELHPEAVLDTEHIRLDDEQAIFRATVTLPSGGRATGYGNCRPEEFRDYIGKAETVAIGRALAALGFGTQFAGDFAEEGRIADAPVTRPVRSAPRNVTATAQPAGHYLDGQAIHQLVKAAGVNGLRRSDVEAEANRRFGEADLQRVTAAQGGVLLEWLETTVAAQ